MSLNETAITSIESANKMLDMFDDGLVVFNPQDKVSYRTIIKRGPFYWIVKTIENPPKFLGFTFNEKCEWELSDVKTNPERTSTIKIVMKRETLARTLTFWNTNKPIVDEDVRASKIEFAMSIIDMIEFSIRDFRIYD